MVVGGILARRSMLSQIEYQVNEIRKSHNVSQTKLVKWSNFKKRNWKFYRSLVDYFFSLMNSRIVHYHTIIFNRHLLDRISYPGASNASVLSRMYYQLFLHRCTGPYGQSADLHLFPDEAQELGDLPQQIGALNYETAMGYGVTRNPAKIIQCVNTEEYQIMQLNDVVVGAIACHRNSNHLSGNLSDHKRWLCEYVRQGTGWSDYSISTSRRALPFSVWNFKSKPRIKFSLK